VCVITNPEHGPRARQRIQFLGEASAVTDLCCACGRAGAADASPSICAACAEADTHTTQRATEWRHGTRRCETNERNFSGWDARIACGVSVLKTVKRKSAKNLSCRFGATVSAFVVVRGVRRTSGHGEKNACYGGRVPVNSTHPDYDANAASWLRARDVFAGEDAVKAAGTRYLPRLDSQSDDEYAAYKSRASFFNATARTVDGFLGLIFRREPTVKLPERVSGVAGALRVFAEDVDLLGTSLYSFSKNIVSEVLTVGRAGSLVDWEDEGEQRAFVVRYDAEQILNWQVARVNGRNVVALVVLRENAEGGMKNDERDAFAPEMVEQLRVLRLVPGENSGWSYQVELWQQREGKTKRAKAEWVKVESRIPLRLGKPLALIPFVFHGPRHSLPRVDKLPLADIIAVNLDHYRLNADYKHGLHFTALPTAWVSGFDKSSNLRIGSSTAWVAETPGATAGFLEFTGQGLTTFERAMDRDERLMAVLGTRMLEAQKRVGESADAIALRQSGENSVLMTLALSVSDSVSQVLRWVYWWNSTEESPEQIGEDLVLLQLNTDFEAKGLSSQELTAMVAAWQAGAISRETMFDVFRRGEVLPAGRSDEEEAKLTESASRTGDQTKQ